ncbi:MAG: hypothetical protein ACLQUW_10205 [Desulfobaccales bacterium]
MSPNDAVMELSRIGFSFRLDGGVVKVRFEGEQPPDRAKVQPLLNLVQAHKPQVLAFLSKPPSSAEQVLTCADCGFHHYAGPNPRQGWGLCSFKNKGCYGLRSACEQAAS